MKNMCFEEPDNCTRRDGFDYKAPGTLDNPVGDEEYNTNLLGDEINELHKDTDTNYQAFDKRKCPTPSTSPIEVGD